MWIIYQEDLIKFCIVQTIYYSLEYIIILHI